MLKPVALSLPFYMSKIFEHTFNQYTWSQVSHEIYQKTEADVIHALQKDRLTLSDFQALLSPAAEKHLEAMAQKSQALTQQRFGKTISLYAPLYLSNECQNICTYCGFSLDIPIRRKTLSEAEIIQEAQILKARGYDHVLLVTGEANKTVGLSYFKKAIQLLKPYFSMISMEVQPLEQEEYENLIQEGLYAVLVYQETYHQEEYKKHHPKGKKSNFLYRLNTPDRLGQSQVHKIGLGILIGLEDWRIDSFLNGLHLDYLEKTYWRTRYSVSFPRLRPSAQGIELKSILSPAQLVQLITAYRLFKPEVELSLSTREPALLRDQLIPLGITSMSAASQTDPGGYSNPEQNLEQFEIDDDRSVTEVIQAIQAKGYQPVFKDWELAYQPPNV